MQDQDLAQLNKEAIRLAKTHMGEFAWPTVMLSLGVVTLFITNLWLCYTAAIPLWVGFIAHAILTYMSYTPLHEAAHSNIHGNRSELKWVNDLCGYICAPIIMVPYSTHTVEHFTHHRFTNQPGKDPDYVVKDMGKGPVSVIVTGLHFLWVQLTFLFRDHWAQTSGLERAIYISELMFALAWRVAALALMPLPMGLALILGAYLVGAFFTAYWFAYRPHHPYDETARYKNTNSMLMPSWLKPLEWFWLGQNLHSIHHAFPRVPFYRYHALYRDIEPILRAHGNPVIGIFSRQPVLESASSPTT